MLTCSTYFNRKIFTIDTVPYTYIDNKNNMSVNNIYINNYNNINNILTIYIFYSDINLKLSLIIRRD